MSGLITIIRSKVAIPSDDKTYSSLFGKIYFNNEYVGVTVEKPWIVAEDGGRGGKKRESCIPCGTYKLDLHNSQRFGSVVCFVNPELDVFHHEEDVPEDRKGKARTECLIHAANWSSQLLGCVAVGDKVQHFEGVGYGVTSSRPTLNKLRALWGMRMDLTAKIRWE